MLSCSNHCTGLKTNNASVVTADFATTNTDTAYVGFYNVNSEDAWQNTFIWQSLFTVKKKPCPVFSA